MASIDETLVIRWYGVCGYKLQNGLFVDLLLETALVVLDVT